jgi:hypothetical protein
MAGVGAEAKVSCSRKKSLPHLFRNKISSYPNGGMLEKILRHQNLFCCNVKGPDIKYVMKQFRA